MSETVVFEIIEVVVRQASSSALSAVRRAQQYHSSEHYGRHLVSTLHTTLVGNSFDVDAVTVRWPADWRQAFKERWFPAWLLRRFPVKYAEKTVRRRVTKVCPHLDVPQEDPAHIEYLIQRKED